MQEAYYVVMREEAMGAEPITGGTKLRLLWFLTFSAKELALPRKEEVFKKGWKSSFSWSSNGTVTDGKEFPVLLKGVMAKRETWDRLIKYRYGAGLSFYCCNRGEL